MKLSTYIKENNINMTVFAARIDVSAVTVHRYCTGKRIPEKKVMAAIYLATGGAVQANDFYEQPTSLDA